MHRFLEPPIYFGPVERPWYNCPVKIASCKLSSCPILNRHIVSACVYSAVFEYSMWDCRECLLVELIYILGYNIPLFQLSASSLIRFLKFVPRSWSFTSKKVKWYICVIDEGYRCMPSRVWTVSRVLLHRFMSEVWRFVSYLLIMPRA